MKMEYHYFGIGIVLRIFGVDSEISGVMQKIKGLGYCGHAAVFFARKNDCVPSGTMDTE